MDELVKLVSQRAGISENQARQAIEVIAGYVKKRLPAPLAGQVDRILEGGDASGLGDLAKGLGGMFGRR
jgi:hypothetical protein